MPGQCNSLEHGVTLTPQLLGQFGPQQLNIPGREGEGQVGKNQKTDRQHQQNIFISHECLALLLRLHHPCMAKRCSKKGPLAEAWQTHLPFGLSVNWMHSDVLSNIKSEEMEALIDAFGSGTTLGIVGNLNGTTVFLEDFAMDLCSGGVNSAPKPLHFFKQPHDRKSVLEGLECAHILSFCCG